MERHDVLVVGGGGAGLQAAIAADEAGADVAIISKLHPVRSHTGAAEGGVNAAIDPADSIEDHAYETMKGADYLADAPAVETFAQAAPEAVIQLEHWGMAFSREPDGSVSQRPFGGMDFPRTAYAGAETGHQMLHTMYQQVVKRGIRVYEEWYVTDLVVERDEDDNPIVCHGVVGYELRTGELAGFHASDGVILATGGLGQIFDHTSNAIANTGDGMAMAYRNGVPLEDMEFIQFHPTTLPASGVLITEGVRGEGGILYNAEGERFMFEYGYAPNAGELASRDVVSRAELTEVNEGRGIEDDHVHLDMRHLGADRILDRLENIVHLAEDFAGVDPLEEPIPVKPGQHYAMGGIETDENGATCLEGLFAAGECACVSMHGANRLGGNSLAELLVFGERAGRAAAGGDIEPATIETGRPGSRDRSSEIPASDPESLVQTTVESERERIQRLRDRDADIGHAAIRDAVQETMTEYVNVFRTREGLETALEDIRGAKERFDSVSVQDPSRVYNMDVINTLETRNILDLAEVIALGALEREESRGAHWRAQHQERRDEEWLRHTMCSWSNGGPELWYKDVVLAGEFEHYEPKERSY